MFQLKDRRSLKAQLSFSSVVVFYHTVGLLLLTHCSEGQFQVICPPQPIFTVAGDDVILPCHLEPASNAVSRALEWTRPDLHPRFVHVRRGGEELLLEQNPSYVERTSMSISKLELGDISLELSRVKPSDAGTYRCFAPILNRDAFVQLVVGSVSSPVISGININSSVVVLQCESKGWYPQPEVFWLDGEGNQLSAGPTETVRGPDDLYTVSSRVTVEKRHSNSFTCRVHQKNFNQTRETEIQISADCFEATSSLAARLSIVVVACLFFIFAAAFVVFKYGQNQTRDAENHLKAEEEERERDQLLAQRKKREDLEEKKGKLEERLQEKEEEQKDLEQAIDILTEQRKEIQNQKDELEHQEKDMKETMEDIAKNFKFAERTAESDQAQGYTDMKTVTFEARKQLMKRKQEDEELHFKTLTLLNKTTGLLKRTMDRKEAVENNKENISEQLEEIQRELQSEQ